MGTFRVQFGVNNGNGGPTEWVEALADTGAVYTMLPASLLGELGVKPKRFMEFSFANAERETLPVGEARFIAEGQDAVSQVIFGAEGQYLLGAVTLQSLALIADTTNHRLAPVSEMTI